MAPRVAWPEFASVHASTNLRMAGNPKRLKQTHLFDAPPPRHVAAVVATIYAWTFDPPFAHPLKGCSYFGQTRRAFEVRTSQHKHDSVRDPKELGLHALWRQYPHDDHWVIQTIEARSFADAVAAHDWMNQEEVRLIHAHGGVLRDMDAELTQTLNLTRGGQGDPRAVWDGLMAWSRRRLSEVWPKFEDWYATGTCIPQGQGPGRMCPQHPETWELPHADFKAWLDARGRLRRAQRPASGIGIWPRLWTGTRSTGTCASAR